MQEWGYWYNDKKMVKWSTYSGASTCPSKVYTMIFVLFASSSPLNMVFLKMANLRAAKQVTGDFHILKPFEKLAEVCVYAIKNLDAGTISIRDVYMCFFHWETSFALPVRRFLLLLACSWLLCSPFPAHARWQAGVRAGVDYPLFARPWKKSTLAWMPQGGAYGRIGIAAHTDLALEMQLRYALLLLQRNLYLPLGLGVWSFPPELSKEWGVYAGWSPVVIAAKQKGVNLIPFGLLFRVSYAAAERWQVSVGYRPVYFDDGLFMQSLLLEVGWRLVGSAS